MYGLHADQLRFYGASVLVLVLALATQAAEFQLTIVEGAAECPIPARVRVRDAHGADHVPVGAQVVPIGAQDQWFVSPGQSLLDVPSGAIQIRVERGTEYRPIKQTIRITDGQVNHHRLRLDRWVNMRARGYTCGENHLHVSAEELAPQLAAEGLDFGTSLQWWNGPRFDVVAQEPFVELEYAGVRVPTSVFDFELEHDWGAAYVIGVRDRLRAQDDKGRPNLPILQQAHQAGALVCYQGGWSREVLLDALLGFVDVVNVCNNNFHRHQFQPRARYSNLLQVAGFPVYDETPEGMLRMNTETYYRLLNCGLRLAAGAGSATGPKNTPVGYNRCYVRAGATPTLPAFLAAWRQGRNFVTNGPMLLLTVADRFQPGDQLCLGPHGGEVAVHVEAISDQPLTSLEVVVNGRVRGAAERLDGQQAELDLKLPISEGAWIAARCTDCDMLLSDDELAAHDYGGNMPRRPCRLRFAHTSPIDVLVGNRSARVPAAIDEAVRMLDAFQTFAQQHAGQPYRAALLDSVRLARQRLTTAQIP